MNDRPNKIGDANIVFWIKVIPAIVLTSWLADSGSLIKSTVGFIMLFAVIVWASLRLCNHLYDETPLMVWNRLRNQQVRPRIIRSKSEERDLTNH